MKPTKNTGTVSSFFTYTGPAHGTQWDEIDIEFLRPKFNSTIIQMGSVVMRRLLIWALMHRKAFTPMPSIGNQDTLSGMLTGL